MPRTLIVGTGIAAAAYAKSKPRAEGETRSVVGGAHLWQGSRMDRHHKMGQPTQLLTGNILADRGRNQAPTGGQFMKAGEFASLTDQALRDSVDEVQQGDVVAIKHGGQLNKQFVVTFKERAHDETFDQVVLAVGPGENRLIKLAKDDPGLKTEGFGGHVLAGDDFMKPDWTRPRTMLHSNHVAIYGGSATAAWIAELAAARGLNVRLWFTRQGDGGGAESWDAGKRFAPAFPAGSRNVKVEQDFRAVRKVLNLTKVELRAMGNYRWLCIELASEAGPELWFPDLLVYALGYEHTATTGVGRILTSALRDELIPYYDKNLAISDKQCLLAVGTADQALMIVGSGMVSAAGIDRAKLRREFGSYSDISVTLPPASRPPEGIAMVLSGIEALNLFVPAKATGPVRTIGTKFQDQTDFKWDINFNTCNRTQLAMYVAQTTDLVPFAANVAVELIMRLRTQKVFGEMNKEMVDRICGYCDGVAKWLKDNATTLDWINEKNLGAGSEEGIKRAKYHEELATYILEKNLLRYTLQS